MSARVNYVLLYRGSRECRTTVATVDELACGALPVTAISEPFDMAAHEFAAVLHENWGIGGAIQWQEIRPDWWGADFVPGALADAGEAAP